MNFCFMSRSRSRSPRRRLPRDDAVEVDSSSDSVATTVLDSQSDNDSSDLPPSVVPYKDWTNMVERVKKCFIGFNDSHKIMLKLAAPDQDWMMHLDHIVNTGLSMPRVTHFKIGVSYFPANRFNYHDYLLLPLMIVSLTSEDCDETGGAEKQAIKRFKPDSRLLNKAPGGESIGHETSPHFLYVVFGLKHQFRRNQR